MKAGQPFTGRHMAAIMIGFFAVVIAVNLYMAREATSTFGGVVVENSYVASQNFNRWLRQADVESRLGWSARLTRGGDGRIAVEMRGLPAGEATVSAIARHPLGRLPEQELAFARASDGRYVATAALPPGRWHLRLQVESGGQVWRREEDLP